MTRKWATWVMLVLLLAACSKGLPSQWGSLSPVKKSDRAPPAQVGDLTVQFLGAGGVFLQSGDQALLGDPFFSNPPLSTWFFGRDMPVRADIIDTHLPPVENVKGILVGHGHFDHALDVPYVAAKLPQTVKVYGSETIPNLLAPLLPAQRLEDLTPTMAKAGQGGQWVYLSPQLRVLPIYSEHSPHLWEKVFAADHVTSPRTTPPSALFDWQSGTNLTFVIDFLGNDQQVTYRIFYQSSASSAPVGFPPEWLLQEQIPFDLAILCGANYNHVANYPEGILQVLQPKQMMLIHWERFWEEYRTDTATPLPGMDFAALDTRIRSVLEPSVPVWVPLRGASIHLSH